MARLIDIADRVGVSHATVSRILSGKQNAPPQVRQKVLRVAKELGYRSVQATAAAGAIESQCVIELVMCNLSRKNEGLPGGFQMQVVRGIQEVAEDETGVTCRVTYVEDTDGKDALFAKLEQADGVILLGNSERDMVEELLRRKVRVVLADHHHEGLGVDCVVSDNISGGRCAAQYLLERGFRRIGWLGGPGHVSAWNERLAGVRLELLNAGIQIADKDLRSVREVTPEAFEEAAEKWVAEGDLPEAIITPTSLSVLMVQHVLARHGLQMPADVSLVSFDDDALSAICRPIPTRVATRPLEIGRKAMQRVLQLRSQKGWLGSHHKVVVPVKLIEGDSVSHCEQKAMQ